MEPGRSPAPELLPGPGPPPATLDTDLNAVMD